MADKRINALANTASSTASDDFIAVDGTTNGTRKLNAFSPTFGGNATVTGTLTSNGSFAATGSMVSTYGTAPQLSIAPSGGRPIRFNASLGNISIQANSGGWYLGTHFLGSAGTHRGSIWAAGTDDSLDFISIGDGSFSQWLSTSSTKIVIPLTTASTTTSSGALVVSGGVGVAKEMYLGGGLLNVAKGGAGSTIEINADSGFASKLAMQRASTNRWTLEVDSSDVLTLKSLGTTAALTMTGTTSAEFVGSIKTAAPAGGTAAAWKLGTVATVSPTSPNRTIEVDIGGTIYYIHAKTTNN